MAIGDKSALPLAVCNKVPDENGNITLSVEDIAELEAALLNKANIPEAIPVGADLNDYRTPGMFYIGDGGKNVLHIPYETDSFSLFVELNNAWGDGVKQTFTSFSSPESSCRIYYNGTWGDWVLLATAADLERKANTIIGESGQPLDKMRPFGFYLIANPTSGFPPGYTSDSHFTLSVTAADPNWSPWLLFDLRTGATFRGGYAAGQFRAWEPIATATPPQEYDLPLAAGSKAAFTDVACVYYKNQYAEIVASATVAPVTGTYQANTATTIATLPAGYRPSKAVRVPAVCYGADSALWVAWAAVYPNGVVTATPSVIATQIIIQVLFVSG